MTCVGEPISWLRLERYAQADLDGAGAAAVKVHLDACAACRAALTSIEDDRVVLPPLPARRAVVAAARTPWSILRRALRALTPASPEAGSARTENRTLRARRRWQIGAGFGGALVAAAIVLLWLRRPDGAGVDELGRRVRVKGAGVVSLTLVRERAGVIAFDPPDIASTDRWKVQLTCGTEALLWTDVVVYQPSGASFPLPAQPITCGNAVAVPGAFRVTDGGAMICVALGPSAPDRDRLRKSPRAPMVCATVAASP